MASRPQAAGLGRGVRVGPPLVSLASRSRWRQGSGGGGRCLPGRAGVPALSSLPRPCLPLPGGGRPLLSSRGLPHHHLGFNLAPERSKASRVAVRYHPEPLRSVRFFQHPQKSQVDISAFPHEKACTRRSRTVISFCLSSPEIRMTKGTGTPSASP